MKEEFQAHIFETEVLKIERIHIKISQGVSGKSRYSQLWPSQSVPKTLVTTWLQRRLLPYGISPENVILNLPNGTTVTGQELLLTASKLRMGDLRLGDDYRPDGMRPVAIGELENRIVERDKIVIFIRRPSTDTVPFAHRKAADGDTTVVEYVKTHLGAYGIAPEEVIIINGHTMLPFLPPPFYTMGQLRATFKDKWQ